MLFIYDSEKGQTAVKAVLIARRSCLLTLELGTVPLAPGAPGCVSGPDVEEREGRAQFSAGISVTAMPGPENRPFNSQLSVCCKRSHT